MGFRQAGDAAHAMGDVSETRQSGQIVRRVIRNVFQMVKVLDVGHHGGVVGSEMARRCSGNTAPDAQ